ncbi:MAG TPA: hypothetical protein VJL29_16025 [Thermoguttaceae bacterium]|nr:hypothetical protein [Thermoguttaceae bacterium]
MPNEHDESLEAGIAAGLDIPTAMVISSKEERSRRPGCLAVIVAVILGCWAALA